MENQDLYIHSMKQSPSILMFGLQNTEGMMRLTLVGIWCHNVDWYRGLFKVSRKVVVKTSSCDPEQQKSNSIRQLRREMRILSGPLKNINGIITLLDKIYGPISLQLEALVYEYLPFTLESVHKETTLATAEVKTIARQLLQALVVLHHHHIVHTGTTYRSRMCFSTLMNALQT